MDDVWPPVDIERRNVELFVRHCAGESYRSLGASHGISGARVEQIAKRAAARLASHLPVTLPSSAGAWTVAKRLRGEP